MLLLFAISCAPEPEPAPRPPSLLVWTHREPIGDGPGAVTTLRRTPSTRPFLATLFTGRLPDRHGVRDPVLHRPAVATLMEQLHRRGWSIHHDQREDWDLLHPGESWGFSRPGPGPSFIWVQDDERDAQHVERWRAAVGGELQVVEISLSTDRVRFEGLEDVPDEIGTVDVGTTLAEWAAADLATDGRDVRTATAGTLLVEDARAMTSLLAPVSTATCEDGPCGATVRSSAPVVEVLVHPERVDAWAMRGEIAGAPFARGRSAANVEAWDAWMLLQSDLRARYYTPVEERLAALERTYGPTPATHSIRAKMLEMRGLSSKEVWKDHASRWPSASIELRLRTLEVDDWMDEHLVRWSDHWLLQEDAVLRDDEAFARVWADAPGRVEVAWLQEAVDADHVVDPEWLNALEERRSDQLLRARALWAMGRMDDAVRRLDDYLTRWPRDREARLWRARWGKERMEGDQVVRLMAPMRRENDEAKQLYRWGRSAVAGERAFVEALRASWRQDPPSQPDGADQP